MAHEALTNQDIGDRLVVLRTALKWPTAAAFAAHLDLTPSALNNYEKGRSKPDYEAAMKIVRKTRVTLDWLYRGIDAGLPVQLAELLSETEEQSRQRVVPLVKRGRRAGE